MSSYPKASGALLGTSRRASCCQAIPSSRHTHQLSDAPQNAFYCPDKPGRKHWPFDSPFHYIEAVDEEGSQIN